MARAGSTTSRTPRKTAAQKAEEAAAAMQAEARGETPEVADEVTAQNDFDSTLVEAENTDSESTNEVEETNDMSTDTVEAEAAEATVSDTNEATEATTAEQDAKAQAQAEGEAKLAEFGAAVTGALAERDTATGTVPEVHISKVVEAYRALPGAKFKTAAKKSMVERLQDAVNSTDIVQGMSVMNLTKAIESAPAGAKAPATPKAPVDPSVKFVDDLTVLHLAYTLRRADVPEGVEVEGENSAFGKVDAKVESLNDQAEAYYAWVKSDAEDKGEEPEVDALVKRAVKAAQGRAASAPRATSSTPRQSSGGPRRNVKTHITQVFAEYEVGTVLKVAEIANAKTEEYPDGDCSPGAISAALKSDKGVEGVEKTTDDKGALAARKTA